jgi:hypothetical protein
MLASIVPLSTGVVTFADSYERHLVRLEKSVADNPLTRTGYWLEMQNVLGQWEKVILIFGYADPVDKAACARILQFAAVDGPNSAFRFNPVN